MKRQIMVTMIMVMTADAIITKKRGEGVSGWASIEDRTQLLKRIKSIGHILAGSTTYKNIEKHPYQDVTFHVLTHSPSKFEKGDKVYFHSGTVDRVLKDLEMLGIKRIALLGCTEINSQFLKEKAVDEIFLTVEPLMFGKGIHLTNSIPLNTQMILKSVTKLNRRGTLLLHYVINKE